MTKFFLCLRQISELSQALLNKVKCGWLNHPRLVQTDAVSRLQQLGTPSPHPCTQRKPTDWRGEDALTHKFSLCLSAAPGASLCALGHGVACLSSWQLWETNYLPMTSLLICWPYYTSHFLWIHCILKQEGIKVTRGLLSYVTGSEIIGIWGPWRYKTLAS